MLNNFTGASADMRRLSPNEYDSALASLSAFISENHCGEGADVFALLGKSDTLAFLELVVQTGFGYLLSEADCLVPDDKNDMVTLPLSFEGEAYNLMWERVDSAPAHAEYIFYDFAPDGRLVDLVRQETWDAETDWEPLTIPDLFRKTH